MTFSSIDFMIAAHAVGVHDPALFVVCPDLLVKQLMDAAKRHARFLSDEFPQVKHRAMLEAIAKASGFPHWHAFQSLMQKIETEYAPPQRGSRKNAPDALFLQLVPALPLLISIPPDVPPTAEEEDGLTGLMTKLTQHLESRSRIATALAKLNGADTWTGLVGRSAEDSSSPLYRFAIDHEGKGHFVWSSACAKMVDDLDALWQRYEERSTSDQARARDHVAQVLAKRPDFLEGWLAYGTMEELEGRELQAGQFLTMGVERATALIPVDFKGEISWMDMDNRPYHRLLYNLMRFHVRDGNISEAAKLAVRQLRENPTDNLGVRFDLPLLLAITKKRTAATKAMSRLETDDSLRDGHALLILALSSILLGEIRSGQVFFLRALFQLPALRPIMLTHRIPDTDDRQMYRGVIPDFTTLWPQYEAARIWRKDVKFEPMLYEMLHDDDVIATEREAWVMYERAFHDQVTVRTDDLSSWLDFANETAVTLVDRHGEHWASAMA